jgi:hypothetical protein
MPQWDAGYTLAALVLFCIFTARAIAAREHAGRPVAAGAIAGVIALANPATVLVCFPWVVFLLVWRRAPMRSAARYISTFALIAVLCNLPWVIRNYTIWHALALRTNFGMTIYASNNDCAQPSLDRSQRAGCYQQMHPVASQAEIALLKQLGEVQYDKQRTEAAIQWIRSHPSRFRELTLARMVDFWFPVPEDPRHAAYAIWAITALSIPGMILMVRRRVAVSALVLFLWSAYPLMYYVTVSSDRYRYPILWTSLLPAGYFLAAIGDWLRGARASAHNPKHKMFGPAATATYCFPPNSNVIGDAFIRTLVSNRHSNFPSRSSTASNPPFGLP